MRTAGRHVRGLFRVRGGEVAGGSCVLMMGSSIPTKGMVLVPCGSFVMGSMDFYPEERPLRRTEAPDLWLDEHPVTNAEFRRFVADTGHRTIAERVPDPVDFPGADPADLVPGSQLFVGTRARCRWMTGCAGGPGPRAHRGNIPRGRAARCTGVNCTRTVSPARRRSNASRPTVSDCSTLPATSGSGRVHRGPRRMTTLPPPRPRRAAGPSDCSANRTGGRRRAALTCARRPIVTRTGLRPGRLMPSEVPPATSVSVVAGMTRSGTNRDNHTSNPDDSGEWEWPRSTCADHVGGSTPPQ